MELSIQLPAREIHLTAAPGASLATALQLHHTPLDLRCAGRGLCNRCRVILESGEFQIDGQLHTLDGAVPLEVNGCRVYPVGAVGRIRIPASSLAPEAGQIAVDFTVAGGDPAAHRGTGIAIDIGTTTVAALLVIDGRIARTASLSNQQAAYGDNVSTRISHAATAAGQTALQHAIVDATLNRLIAELAPGPVDVVAIAGNTVMTHLLFGYPVDSIGVMPFEPLYRRFPERSAHDLGLAVTPTARVLAVPAISGYVGGDITAGLGEVALRDGEMLVDLGTNCEMVLRLNGREYCTAAAAGPAFEGAGIRCGMRAADGAIDHVRMAADLTVEYSVIGDVAPRGVCGSGLLDWLHAARQVELLNEFGRLELDRLQAAGRYRQLNGIHGALLADGSDGELVITEADIEQLLKAKAAVHAGILSLLDHVGATTAELRKIYLAGGFAKFLNLDSALALGMLPRLPGGDYELVGNTALAGALALVRDPRRLRHYEELAAQPQDLPLNVIASFEMNYIDSLMLP